MIRYFIFIVVFAVSFFTAEAQQAAQKNRLSITIDIVNVKDDKVQVVVLPPKGLNNSQTYHFARIIPGTYAIADYGRYVGEVSATDSNGKNIPVIRKDVNTLLIADAGKLARLTYWVDDTFDTETGADVFSSGDTVIFSPAGTNILESKQFLMNLSGFAGYFKGMEELPYQINVRHPANLYGATAKYDQDTSAVNDRFDYDRFADVVDNPIMYSEPDTATFKVGNMEVLLSLYAPDKQVSAKSLKPALEKMMIAQKRFMGKLNTTSKYAVLAYLTTSTDGDAKGIGALEHNNSTTAVFRRPMNKQDLIAVISHEFFHTITPLKVHSKEIRYFDFQSPKMSRHLWFYEGVTEYFANLFQVNQGLIDENRFYDLMAAKVLASQDYNDTVSFTEMSRNVLQTAMKKQYPNVYQKGALIAMCLDIMLREHSGGKEGLRSLMEKLVHRYGAEKPFDDETFLDTVTKMTFPKLGTFLNEHVAGNKPIEYTTYLERVGLTDKTVMVPEPIVFVADDVLYINIDADKKQVIADLPDNNNKFLSELGVKNGDVLVSLNGYNFEPGDGSASLMLGYGLEEGAPVTMRVLREGKQLDLKGKVKINYKEADGFRFTDTKKVKLKNAWLKN